MEQFIGCDAHKKFCLFVAMDENGKYGPAVRVNNQAPDFTEYLRKLPTGSQIALEAGGTYYWLVDAMQAAGHQPKLAHPLEAKKRMGGRKKTDKEDAQGLAMLLRNGTLPEVWIPPPETRDQRELLRSRMFLVGMRTQMKNRIHGILTRFNIVIEASDLFGVGGRRQLSGRLCELPEHTRQSVEQLLASLDFLVLQVEDCEARLELMLGSSAERDLLQTMPCIGKILGAVIALEIGDVRRFASAERLASYAGTVPGVKGTGGRNRLVRCSQEVNQNLKWALVEAANLVVLNQRKLAGSHVLRLYQRVKRSTKNHGKATTAVARHLAEAAYWILTKQQEYREPKSSQVSSSTHG